MDLISTIGESAALGAAGVILWGDAGYTTSKVSKTEWGLQGGRQRVAALGCQPQGGQTNLVWAPCLSPTQGLPGPNREERVPPLFPGKGSYCPEQP